MNLNARRACMARISSESLAFWMDAWTDATEDNRTTRLRDFSRAMIALAIVDNGHPDGVLANLVRQASSGKSIAVRLAAFDALLIMSEEIPDSPGVLHALQDGLQDADGLV